MPPPGALLAKPQFGSGSHAWLEFRRSLPLAQAILQNHHQILCLRKASSAALAKYGRELPFEDEPDIYPESLRQTLDAHRAANRASLIHKVAETGETQSLVLRPPATETPQNVPERKPETAIHLKFTRAKQERGHRVTREPKNADYTGKSRPLTAQWRNKRPSWINKRLPWLSELSAASGSPFDKQCPASERLTSEILAFHEYVLPKPGELAAAEQAISALHACVKSIDASVQVDLIGSRRTGLATPLSDLDFNITHPNGGDPARLSRDREREQAQELLRLLWEKLPKRRNFVQASSFVDGARVPIITGLHSPTNLKFQIQCTGDVFNSMRYTQDCVAEYPTLRPLYMILRQMLEIRGLNVGRLGGLGSYPLLIMIVAALKFCETWIGRKEAGKQFCFFLDMYSKIDFYTTAISLVPLECIVKGAPERMRLTQQPARLSSNPETYLPASIELSEAAVEGRKWFRARAEPHLMCLQDPSNPGHDLGRQVKLIKHVQALMIEANSELRESMDAWDATDWTQNTTPKGRFALLDWCLGADYEIFEDERMLLNAVGQSYSQTEPS